VDVAAEHDLLAEDLAVVLGQVVVAALGGDLLVGPVGERVGAGGGDPQALAPGRLDQGPPGPAKASRTSARVVQTGVLVSTMER
jgi:hypothetical protein